MGLYNYVGYDGEQVKCFYVPAINIDYNRETKECKVNIFSSGGRLEGCNDAPYMTHYYNYGKDFAILENRLIEDEENPYIHVFRDGKFVETVYVNDVGDDYDLPSNVIDNWGTWTTAHNIRELKALTKEHREADVTSRQMEIDALEQIGLSYKLGSFAEMQKRGIEAMQQEFQMREKISTEVHNLIWKPWIEKWEDNSRESDLQMIGLVLDDYIHDMNVRQPDGWGRKEFEWHVIFTYLLERLCDQFNNPVEDYFDWAEKWSIEMDRNWVLELFSKYTKPVSDELVKEYEDYLDHRGW
jgi:hypothetical protein